MLLSIRDRARGWVAWLIVGLISVPFALWGLHSYFTGPDERIVAEVGGEEITDTQYRRAFQMRVQELRDAWGDQFPPELLDDERFSESVLEGVVAQTLLQQFIADQGFAVSDTHLAQNIRSIQAFHANGGFSEQRYQQLARTQYGSVGAFENEMRRSLMNEQLTSGIGDTAVVTDREFALLVGVRYQQREIEYLQIPAERFVDQVSYDESDIEAFYQANQDRFRTRPRVRLAYLELDPEAVAAEISVSEEDLRHMYEAEQHRFTTPEDRRASHILISLDNREREEARALAEELYSRLQDGEDFSELAGEYSDDALSAGEGGDLGWVSRDDMVRAFEDALFALEEGAISEPVRTRFGFHLIRFDDARGGEVTPFEEVRDELEESYRRDRIEQDFFDMSEALADITFDHGGSLEPAADYLDLEIRETDWFTREGGEGIARHSRVVEEAFMPEVLDEGLNSAPIELADGRMLVVRRLEHEPARVRDLEEVREEVVADLRAEGARKMAREQGMELLSALREGTLDWDEAVDEAGFEVTGPLVLPRGSREVSAAIGQAAFRLPRPDDGVSLGETETEAGDFVLIRLIGVKDGDLADLDENERREQLRQLARMRGNTELDAFIDSLRERERIRLYTDRL